MVLFGTLFFIFHWPHSIIEKQQSLRDIYSTLFIATKSRFLIVWNKLLVCVGLRLINYWFFSVASAPLPAL